eukprot:scaffold3799_cov178-Prasinococcus_capsulatus_cf.AAC.1
MKGSPEAPRCGFSRRVVEHLDKTGAKYGSFDILSNEQIRQGLKQYSDWPTYPQLYVDGELLGGCDIVCEMGESGELADALKGSGEQAPTKGVGSTKQAEEEDELSPELESRLKKLIGQDHAVLFMKGTPEEPRCKFSRAVVDALHGLEDLKFSHVNILEDEE